MRRILLAAVCVLSACSKSSHSATPTSPDPVPVAAADFSGLWTGIVNYQGCVGRHCGFEMNDPFSLRARQNGTHVTAVFEIRGDNIEVAGDVQPDGSLSLTGSDATGGTRGVTATATFAAQGLRLDAARGIDGKVRYEVRNLYQSEILMPTVYDATILSASHQSLDAYILDESGWWTGRYLVRACEDDLGRPICDPFRPDEVEFLEFRLQTSGSDVTGLFGPVTANIPVTGRLAGRTLRLEGSRDVDQSGGTLAIRVTNLSATVDDFGRMNGSFTYTRTFRGRVSTAQVDMRNIIKRP